MNEGCDQAVVGERLEVAVDPLAAPRHRTDKRGEAVGGRAAELGGPQLLLALEHDLRGSGAASGRERTRETVSEGESRRVRA